MLIQSHNDHRRRYILFFLIDEAHEILQLVLKTCWWASRFCSQSLVLKREFPALIDYRVYKSPPLDAIVSQLTPDHVSHSISLIRL